MNDRMFAELMVWLVRKAYKIIMEGDTHISISEGTISGQFIAKNGITINF